jgi:hypothetical protein
MRIRSLVFVVSLVSILGGCIRVTDTPIFTPSGKQGFTIDCSGQFSTWSKCYEKAGELCGATGYNIIEKTGDQASSVSGTEYGVYGSQSATRTLVIACKP